MEVASDCTPDFRKRKLYEADGFSYHYKRRSESVRTYSDTVARGSREVPGKEKWEVTQRLYVGIRGRILGAVMATHRRLHSRISCRS
jgi:hypothetical protein